MFLSAQSGVGACYLFGFACDQIRDLLFFTGLADFMFVFGTGGKDKGASLPTVPVKDYILF
jgi:hypothetical protein